MFSLIHHSAQNSAILIEGLSSRLAQHRTWSSLGQSKSPLPSNRADKNPSSQTSRRRSVHDHHRCFHVSYRLAVRDARVALPNFYDVTVRIANVAARLAVFGLWLCDELGSSASPQFIARLNICNADVHEAAD
jgi:hypothetical protein